VLAVDRDFGGSNPTARNVFYLGSD